MEHSNVMIMAELNLLLKYGPLPLKYVEQIFKEKGYTKKELMHGIELTNLRKDEWNGVTYLSFPELGGR
ncbi:hypothetical protein A0U40_05345 [[Bacillus] sp. KCTC 13219]|nr:hypothetical protein A0U40_05345 [[Bacillus] sp. KCTC 13219]